MSTHTLTLDLPEPLFRYLEQVARLTRQPLERVVAQSIAGNLPPDTLSAPADLRSQLAELQRMTAADLRAEAAAQVAEPEQRRHFELLERNTNETITPDEQRELEQLRAAADALMLRKAYAAAVLRWLGEPDPDPPPASP
jgi:hypothetical protein